MINNYLWYYGLYEIREIFIERVYDRETKSGWWAVSAPTPGHPAYDGYAYVGADRLEALAFVVEAILADTTLKLASSVQIHTSV